MSCRSRGKSGGRFFCRVSQTIRWSTPKYSWTTKFRISRISRQESSGYMPMKSSDRCEAASPMTKKFRITASMVLRSEMNCSKVIPAVYFKAVFIASVISAMRSSQLLCGTNRLSEDILFHSIMKGIRCGKIHKISSGTPL